MKLREVLGGHLVSGPEGYKRARTDKARKLVEILQQETTLSGVDILDVGCGSGLLISSVKELLHDPGRIVGVDIVEPVPGDFQFKKVTDTKLPFPDRSFDVAISNHVIEHVGDDGDQTRHLIEINRVLRPGGVLYMACPNKWSLVEPHYNLAFLSWLPRGVASVWLRVRKRGKRYDWRPLSRRRYIEKAHSAGFTLHDHTYSAFRLLVRNELTGSAKLAFTYTPDWLLRASRSIIPTFVFVAKKEMN